MLRSVLSEMVKQLFRAFVGCKAFPDKALCEALSGSHVRRIVAMTLTQQNSLLHTTDANITVRTGTTKYCTSIQNKD